MKLQVGDIVRYNQTKGKRILPYRYVVVAVPPTNNLVKGAVDVIPLEEAKKPLRTRGIGIPTKYLVKAGKFV